MNFAAQIPAPPGSKNNSKEEEPTADIDRIHYDKNAVEPTTYERDLKPEFLTEPPLESIRASGRFFVPTGSSRSLIEEARLSLSLSRPLECEGHAVVALSRDPYADFRQSMMEMVEARHADPEEPLDWEFMEELLCCLLQVNDRCVHRDIVRAFTDIAATRCRCRA